MRSSTGTQQNRGGRPRREVDTAELLRLRQEGSSWREIGRKMGLGKGTVCRAYQAATGTAQVSQNPEEPDYFELPPHLKIRLWLLRARVERERLRRDQMTKTQRRRERFLG